MVKIQRRSLVLFAVSVTIIACVSWSTGRPLLWLGFTGSLVVCQVLLYRQARKAQERARRERMALLGARPEGVVIEREDGTRLNVELVDGGQDDEGFHHWWVAGAVLRPGDTLHVDSLPPRHEINGEMEP